jgi:CubicO group peptidase (beta-lactamase class C family)
MRLTSLLVALLLTFPALAQSVEPRAVDRIMVETMRAWRAPGAAVAIVRNDRVVYTKGYGTKDLTTMAPVTPDTMFQIASATKAFTTTAMAMLVDEKKLAWDDAVRKHVPYFRLDDPCADAQVTLRDVVSHRTGLSGHDELWDGTPLSREQVLRAIGEVALSRPLRTGYQYQNIMFVAAGEAVTASAGVSWDDFVRTRIFEPLQMKRTRTLDADWTAESDRAVGHRWDAAGERAVVQKPIATANLGSAGAIKSTAREMANWVRFQLAEGSFEGQRLVSAEALNETHTPQTIIRLQGSSKENNPESNLHSYGLGWFVQDYAGTLLVSHSGSLNGFRTHVDLLPKQKSGFIIWINIGRSAATVAMRNALLDLLLGRPARDWNAYYLALDAKQEAASQAKRAARDARRRSDRKPSHDLAEYAGTYVSAAYGTAVVTVENDALTLRWNQLTLPLSHYHYDVFTAVSEEEFVDEQIEFATAADGEVKRMSFYGQTFTR